MINANDVQNYRETNSNLYHDYKESERVLIDAFDLKQFNQWCLLMKRLDRQNESYPDTISFISQSGMIDSMYQDFVQAFNNWKHFDNRSCFKLLK